MSPPFVIGYGTNGFADHPLPVALDVMAHYGYEAVALTLGHPHFDPFGDDWAMAARQLAVDLRRRGMRVVVETGTRYLLDPLRKHRPTLVDPEAAERMRFLRRAVEITALLDADCVSIWSGVLRPEVDSATGWRLLLARMAELVSDAADLGVTVSFEPEPGMLVETVADALVLHSALGAPVNLGITVDLGHCVAVEPDGVDGALLAAGPLLRNVQVDDMRPGVHEHLPLGDGDLDLDLALRTLCHINYRGVIAMELPRHSHAAPELAARSIDAIRATSVFDTGREQNPWLVEALDKVRADPGTIVQIFPEVGRRVGRSATDPADPSGVVSGTVDDHARAELLLEAIHAQDPDDAATTVLSLYRQGDDAERRGVLTGLNALPQDPPAPLVTTGREVVLDALRTNDSRIVAAALGQFAGRFLDQHDWRHGVLKAVFMQVPLVVVADLDRRTDDELIGMARRLVTERQAAGRQLSDDLIRLSSTREETSGAPVHAGSGGK